MSPMLATPLSSDVCSKPDRILAARTIFHCFFVAGLVGVAAGAGGGPEAAEPGAGTSEPAAAGLTRTC